ncbi:MAG TPA: histidine kinase, partial [Roseiflexaceae bacterium]|nr:histidine kinase [Roseiflexaceae bacterium]
MTSGDQPQSIQELHSKASAELDKVRREVVEIENLIRQNSNEVDKLQQRKVAVSNRLRDLEVNVDRYNKSDIKNLFTSAHEVEMRLMAMLNQLEQLQFRQQTMKNRQSQLFELINALEPFLNLNAAAGASRPAERGEELIANIIQAQEKERLRISLQMHDGPAQSMSNLVLRAEICQRLIDRDIDMARSELGSLKAAINTTLQDIRRFIFDLRPMTLDDLGLVPTLRRYVQQFTEKNKLEINLMTQNADARLPSHYEVAIFRFVQEALNNVVKHANATQARILLDVSGDGIHVSVEDDGSGFHVNDVLAESSSRRNIGIATLRQHSATHLGG